ncbi:MAG TPA: nucleotidyltransferase [Acidimicrobiia bacterium]|nr:nucleotidyltransferase [Acidimicrobiia bacterium]
MTYPKPFSGSSPLRFLADDLDPPPERKQAARDRYTDLGEFLTEVATNTVSRDVNVYPQGSYKLGTTTRDPFTGEFDVDLVIHVDFHKSEISQQDLNDRVGGWLDLYANDRYFADSSLAPSGVKDGSRAWTLVYDDHFHMDALPVAAANPGEIPSTAGTPEWLTDKSFRNWLETNPSGLAEWFKSLTRPELETRAKVAKVEVEELPPEQAKSSMQRAIQILKRHRDHTFEDDEADLAPPSVLITVLVGLAYLQEIPYGGDVGDVLRAVVPSMPEFLQPKSGELWLPNPTCIDENYADRYDGRRDKEKALYTWLEQVDRDLEDLADTKGLDALEQRFNHVFGAGYGSRVARKVGEELQAHSQAGSLFTSAAGGLSTAASDRPPNPGHTFYGETP